MSSARPIVFFEGSPRALERIALQNSPADGGAPRYSERWLQEIIQNCPEVLPTDEIEPGFGRLIPVGMEIDCGHGTIDNLFVTADGGIAIVETKLGRNPEARRHVVAQALDYASALARLSYSDFEKRALNALFPSVQPAPSSLYEFVADTADARDEGSFIDAITKNLRRGRMLVIAAGDGVRVEAEALADLLQSHAGARFTFALVAIELFEGPNEQIFAVPRTVAKTVLIERGVVRVEDDRVVVGPAPPESKTASGRITMTEEMFLEIMAARNPKLPDAIRSFLDSARELGVTADWRASLNLKWYGDRETVNLGYFRKDGSFATDTTYYTAKAAPAARRYLERIAQLTSGKLVENNATVGPYVIAANGKVSLRIDQLLPARADEWLDAIRQFIREMTSAADNEPS